MDKTACASFRSLLKTKSGIFSLPTHDTLYVVDHSRWRAQYVFEGFFSHTTTTPP